MLASEMIEIIKDVERNHHGITQLYPSRINYFQSQNLSTVEVEYDSAFDDFIAELEAALDGKVYIPTAKKILNNWYIWAEENLEALSNIEPFVPASDPIEWLIKNDFRIDHAVFAKDATADLISCIEEKMPKDSDLFRELKEVADKKYSGSRGFTYPYLVKVVAGFLSLGDGMWPDLPEEY